MYENPLTVFFSNIMLGILSKFPLCCVLRYSIERLRSSGWDIHRERWIKDTGFPFSIYQEFNRTGILLPCGLFHHFRPSTTREIILELLPYIYDAWKPQRDNLLPRAIIEQILIQDPLNSTSLTEELERKLGSGIDFSDLPLPSKILVGDLIIKYYAVRRGLFESYKNEDGERDFRMTVRGSSYDPEELGVDDRFR
jgi:hypothetical protein